MKTLYYYSKCFSTDSFLNWSKRTVRPWRLTLLILPLFLMVFANSANAQCTPEYNKRILVYQPNSTDFNRFYPSMETAFNSQGYTISIVNSFPTSIVSSLQDTINGYEAFFMMGEYAYNSARANTVNQYLSNSGKVYLGWEVSCCLTSQQSAVDFVNNLVNGASISIPTGPVVGGTTVWTNPCDTNTTLTTAAYRNLDGIPVANQINVDSTYNGNNVNAGNNMIGFRYTANDLNAGAGSLIGFGDVNFWFTTGNPANGIPIVNTTVLSSTVNYVMQCLLCRVECTVGSATPAVPSTLALACPASTADLTTLSASNVPSGAILTWHDSYPATTANKITGVNVPQGSYFAAFYDSVADCYGSGNTQVDVTSNCPCTAAGTNAPNLSTTTIGNTCPTNFVDLTSITASNTPANTTVTWHTATPATNGNKIAGNNIMTSGTFYAAFYDATNDCYSGLGGSATSPVTVTFVNCCTAGTTSPALSTTVPYYNTMMNTLYNACPATTADLTVFTASNLPSNAVISWHTATPATVSNMISNISSVTGGPSPGIQYYAAIHDTINNCYSGLGSATSVVNVVTNPCCFAGPSAPGVANTSVTNACPSTTVDLTQISVTIPFPNPYSIVTWHTATPATNANKISGTTVAAGTYYAAVYDTLNDCYSGFTGDSTTAVAVSITSCGPTCAAGSNAPSLSATNVTNTCPSSTYDLTSITASNLPASTTLTWHTATPATNANKISGTAVSAGTYYAAFYDATLDCYSGTGGAATSSVTVTQTPCCNAGTVAPTVN